MTNIKNNVKSFTARKLLMAGIVERFQKQEERLEAPGFTS
jgi:hypothetical protein